MIGFRLKLCLCKSHWRNICSHSFSGWEGHRVRVYHYERFPNDFPMLSVLLFSVNKLPSAKSFPSTLPPSTFNVNINDYLARPNQQHL